MPKISAKTFSKHVRKNGQILLDRQGFEEWLSTNPPVEEVKAYADWVEWLIDRQLAIAVEYRSDIKAMAFQYVDGRRYRDAA
jgi:hypothetical protein